MAWIIRKQARDGSDAVGTVAAERFDLRKDAEYLAALLEEFSRTHRYWADEECS
jgi:hypothetical protein